MRFHLLVPLALATALTASCAGTAPPRPAVAVPCPPPAARSVPPPPPALPPAPVPVAPRVTRLVMGTSVEGRTLELLSVGLGHDVVLVIAGLHGNEPAGTPLAHALVEYLQRHAELLQNRRVLVLPDANPDGRVARTRRNARGIDLNRNYQGPGALSEPEAEAVDRVIRLYTPHRVLSLHQPLACVDHDGPALGLAARVSTACGLPLKKLGTRPGSLGAWLGEGLQVPLITLELPADATRLDADALWARYGPALLSFVTGVTGA